MWRRRDEGVIDLAPAARVVDQAGKRRAIAASREGQDVESAERP
jgi:hypothetical protein